MATADFGWCFEGFSIALQNLHNLVAALDAKLPVGESSAGLDYLRYHLCPLLGLVQPCIEDIEPDFEHPRRESWNTSLVKLRENYSEFNAKLKMRNGFSVTESSDNNLTGYQEISWETLLEGVEELKNRLRDVLLDIEWLINLELRAKFEDDFLTLEHLSETIESHGTAVAIYRRDLQEILRNLQANEQDCETIHDLSYGNAAEFAQRMAKYHTEARAMSCTLQRVQNILEILNSQLAAHKAKCTSDGGKRQFNQLQAEVKKRATAMSRLYQRYDNTNEISSEIVRMMRKLGAAKGPGSFSTEETRKRLLKFMPHFERLYDRFRDRSRELVSKSRRRPSNYDTSSDIASDTSRESSESSGSGCSLSSSSTVEDLLPNPPITAEKQVITTTTISTPPSPKSPTSSISTCSNQSFNEPLSRFKPLAISTAWPPHPTRSPPPVPDCTPAATPMIPVSPYDPVQAPAVPRRSSRRLPYRTFNMTNTQALPFPSRSFAGIEALAATARV